MQNTYDMLVIGAGAGGLVTAAGSKGVGAKVGIIEKKFMGGDCLNFGCVPSKAFLAAANIAHTVKGIWNQDQRRGGSRFRPGHGESQEDQSRDL